jgi:uncharacterized protein YjiK
MLNQTPSVRLPQGVAFDPRRGDLYAVVEKDPMRVLRVDLVDGLVTELFDAQARLSHRPAYLSDLAGVAYDARSQTLAILSHEQRRVAQTSLDGTVLSVLQIGGNQPEGVALSADGREMLIASEPNELLRYVRKGSGYTATRATRSSRPPP